jgi:hypothetical protein
LLSLKYGPEGEASISLVEDGAEKLQRLFLLRESCTRKRDRKQHGVKLKSEATRLKTQVENSYADSTS